MIAKYKALLMMLPATLIFLSVLGMVVYFVPMLLVWGATMIITLKALDWFAAGYRAWKNHGRD